MLLVVSLRLIYEVCNGDIALVIPRSCDFVTIIELAHSICSALLRRI